MQKELLENNVILKLSFDFSLMVINYCELLDQEKKYIIGKQLLRSATSIGACAMEAQRPKARQIHT
jgi:four helix bundle protein